MSKLECNGYIIVFLLSKCYSDFFKELDNAKKASDEIEAPKILLAKIKLVKGLIESTKISHAGLCEVTGHFGMMRVDFTRRYRESGFAEVYALTDIMAEDLEKRK